MLFNLSYYLPLLGMILAFAIAYFAMPIVIHGAKAKNIVDQPNFRSSHNNATPILGGLGIFLSIVCSYLIFVQYLGQNSNWFLLGLMMLFFTGVKDDVLDMDAKRKLLVQIGAAGFIVIGEGLLLDPFFGLIEMNTSMQLVFGIIFMVGFINAFNFIDGVDGLSAGTAIIICLALGGYFLYAKQPVLALVGFATVGSLVAYLKFNFSKTQKIFMGDSGTLILGLILAYMAINFINLPVVAREFAHPLLSMILILFFPILDICRVVYKRLSTGKHPFVADRKHLHHALLAFKISHWKVSVILFMVQFTAILLAWTFKAEAFWMQLIVILGYTVMLLSVLAFFLGRRKEAERLEFKTAMTKKKIGEVKVKNKVIA